MRWRAGSVSGKASNWETPQALSSRSGSRAPRRCRRSTSSRRSWCREPSAVSFRLALIGAGRMGTTHARALASSAAVEIACVVDPSDEAASRIDAPRATLDDLPEVDGALVAAPSKLHVEVLEQLARYGLPVLCEKPCGLTVDETRRIASLGLRLQVAYWRRFVPALRRLRKR